VAAIKSVLTSRLSARHARSGHPEQPGRVRWSARSHWHSKFQTCLPPRLESAFLAEVLTDPAAARLAIAGTEPS